MTDNLKWTNCQLLEIEYMKYMGVFILGEAWGSPPQYAPV